MFELGAPFWESTVAGAIRAGTPLLYAGIGQLVYERSGVLNLSVEGMMITGALAGVVAQVAWNAWPLSIVAALAAGAAFGVVHGLICTVLRANQVATGLALVILAQGLTAFWGRDYVGLRVEANFGSGVPALADIPFVGAVLFRHDILVYAGVALAFAAWGLLYRSAWGIRLRAVGEDAQAAAARGLPVVRTRIVAAAIAGALCALGGAYLSLAYASQWQDDMVAGRGWIALVLVISSTWRPRLLVLVTFLFGGLSALQLNLQAGGVTVSSYLLGMLPFVLSIAVLVVASVVLRERPVGIPADLGKPYEPLP